MLKDIYSEFLFNKGILVGNEKSENAFYTLFALANKLNISIASGGEYAHEDMLPFAAKMLGEDIPLPFYRNFPRSVRELTQNELFFDQLLHYAVTYGLGNFSEPGYSVFEEDFARCAFRENAEIKKFVILTEECAIARLKELISNMLLGSRPLNVMQYRVLLAFVKDYGFEVKECVCKDTVIHLLIDTEDIGYSRLLTLSDVIKLVDAINYEIYGNTNIRKLNFKNRDRRLVSNVIDEIIRLGRINIRDCFEKKALFCGLLHHIHYEAKCAEGEKFLSLMRSKGNQSVYSEFERALLLEDVKKAAAVIRGGKGVGALMRHLNYILSRARSEDDIAFVIESLTAENAIIIIQLLMQYAGYKRDEARTFKFTRYNRLRIHTETDDERARRKSTLDKETVRSLSHIMRQKLVELLSGRLGKVYISKGMYNTALPLQENTSNGGFGVLPKGTRIPLDKSKKIRAFTYWEKVNDIDLGLIGITKDGKQYEFSWRTMFVYQSEAITYSGDQTSGYNGGSEYFDLDISLFKKLYPNVKYLIFTNNVYSNSTFSRCYCKAGYMLRDIDDSGEIFEPKTVKSSFLINCDSTFAYLFGIDLKKNEFVWLNTARESRAHVAGETALGFLTDYFNATSVLSVGDLFEIMSTELTNDPLEADIIVSDEDLPEKDDCEVIRSHDFERINALISNN